MLNQVPPPLATIILEPDARGVDPWRETTVATARTWPARSRRTTSSWNFRVTSVSRRERPLVLLPPALPGLRTGPEPLAAHLAERVESALAAVRVGALQLLD